jgi:hypothetical protein
MLILSVILVGEGNPIIPITKVGTPASIGQCKGMFHTSRPQPIGIDRHMLPHPLRNLQIVLATALLCCTALQSPAISQEASQAVVDEVNVTLSENDTSAVTEADIRRIVEEVLATKSIAHTVTDTGTEWDAATAAPVAGECESGDCFDLDDFLSNKLSVTLGNGGHLKIYGYGRGDLIFANSRLSSTIVPFYVLSDSSVPKDDSQFNTNVRLTRLGFDYTGK